MLILIKTIFPSLNPFLELQRRARKAWVVQVKGLEFVRSSFKV
jgi:hypothetical protein